MRFGLVMSLLFTVATATAAEASFKHDVTSEKKPWTHENFQNDPEEFSFIIMPDRTGSERDGVFPEALRKANLFHPEFIMTVGDLIEGQMLRQHQDHEHLRKQWRELNSFTAKSEAPFFHVVGNHDICRTREGFPRSNETSREVWEENCGTSTYYSFVYKNVLFICLNTMEGKDSRPHPTGLTEEQIAWAKDVLKKNPDVRWTLVFLHQPDECASSQFKALETELLKRDYTVFAGDWHCYVKFQRYNRNYYVLATSGGISKQRGLEYGEFDHLTYVTMTKKGPKVVNIKLDGILDDDVVDAYNTKSKLRRNLDIPQRKAKSAPAAAAATTADGKWKFVVDDAIIAKYANRKNASVNNGVMRIAGDNSRRRWECFKLDMPAPAGKKVRLTADIRTNINKGTFSVMIRRVDSEGSSIDYDGPVIKKSQDWTTMSEIIELQQNTASLELYIQTTENMDPASYGEVRNIVIEEVPANTPFRKTAVPAAQNATSAAPAAGNPTKWVLDNDMINKYVRRGAASVNNGAIRIIGDNSRRRWEAIPVTIPIDGVKKLKLTAEIRSDITKGRFAVMVRRINTEGNTLDYDGPIVKGKQDWTVMTEIIDISPNTAKLELFIQTIDSMDPNSFGEVRNIVIEKIK